MIQLLDCCHACIDAEAIRQPDIVHTQQKDNDASLTYVV